MLMRYGFNCFGKLNLKNIFCIVVVSLLILAFLVFLLNVSFRSYMKSVPVYNSDPLHHLKVFKKIVVPLNTSLSGPINAQCCYYTCFNAYRCGYSGERKIQVYVYPISRYFSSEGKPVRFKITKEFYIILKTIIRSKYYTSNPDEACIFVPSIDTLNRNNLSGNTSKILTLLPYWNNGENHLVFNMMPGKQNSVIDLQLGNAVIAGSGFDSWTYRASFDISLPVFSPLSNYSFSRSYYTERTWLVVSSQLNMHKEYKSRLKKLSRTYPHALYIMGSCSNFSNITTRCYQNITYNYPHILQKAKFCIILRSTRLSQPVLLEALASGCVPIILADTIVMPFQEIIDWKRAVIFVPENYIDSVVDIALSVSEDRRLDMSAQSRWLYEKYFWSLETITNTTLDILNQRVFPEHSLHYNHWNMRSNSVGIQMPLFLRARTARSQGFTAVILAYDRVDSLFLLAQRLTSVPSLSTILVVWNNQLKPPPPLSRWPKIEKPLKIIRTSANKLSNRFYPYKEIETDAVLSLDDDISMLTADELDFGFEVWREFPDRLVGFPSRTNVWDNVTNSWRYESEWTNQISMVLTGAAFYHKYWNYLYTTSMPREIRDWVDEHMNCEDIAMNFLIANVTNKAPIKVAPRKKFKCPECTNTEMLSADLEHMIERSSCINKFTEIYGKMPLKPVEFRADPVLYKDSFPAKLKRYRNIGNL